MTTDDKKEILKTDSETITKIVALCTEGLKNVSAIHKQWYLERILETIGFDIEIWHESVGWDEGVPP